MILLRDPHICPQCFQRTVSRDVNRCTTCQCRLMWPDGNFAQLQREEWKHFYVFFKDRGWVHADHVGKDTSPLTPDVKLTKPPESYGRQALPEGCSAN